MVRHNPTLRSSTQSGWVIRTGRKEVYTVSVTTKMYIYIHNNLRITCWFVYSRITSGCPAMTCRFEPAADTSTGWRPSELLSLSSQMPAGLMSSYPLRGCWPRFWTCLPKGKFKGFFRGRIAAAPKILKILLPVVVIHTSQRGVEILQRLLTKISVRIPAMPDKPRPRAVTVAIQLEQVLAQLTSPRSCTS